MEKSLLIMNMEMTVTTPLLLNVVCNVKKSVTSAGLFGKELVIIGDVMTHSPANIAGKSYHPALLPQLHHEVSHTKV